MQLVASTKSALPVTTYDQLLNPKPDDESEARQGNIAALLRLGRYYDVVQVDPKRAAYYYEEAATRGSAAAARALADVHVSKGSFDAGKAIVARRLMRQNISTDPLSVETDAVWAKNAYLEAISNGISRRAAEPLLRFAESSR